MARLEGRTAVLRPAPRKPRQRYAKALQRSGSLSKSLLRRLDGSGPAPGTRSYKRASSAWAAAGARTFAPLMK